MPVKFQCISVVLTDLLNSPDVVPTERIKFLPSPLCFYQFSFYLTQLVRAVVFQKVFYAMLQTGNCSQKN